MTKTSRLAGIYFFSGLSSLIFQIVWQRLLAVQSGVGAVAIALIVGAYMFGLGLGSLLGGWLAKRTSDPLGLCGVIFAVLGGIGLASVPLIFALGRLTAASPPAVFFVSAFVFLCLPTLLMGMTLPLLTSVFVRLTGDFIFSVSRLYFVNTLGAAGGAVLTSFVLISLLGLDGCAVLAAAVDFVLAGAILLARRKARPTAQTEGAGGSPPEGISGLGRWAYLFVFVTGFIALGYEIIWFRVIGVLVKDSPYAFSSVLAVYLLGLALGGRAIHRYLARKLGVSRRDLYFRLQFLIGLSVLVIFIAVYYLSRYPPLQPLIRISFSEDLHPSLALFQNGWGWHSFKDAFLFLDIFLWPLAFLFAPTFLMGASFPLISSLALRRCGEEGSAVGTTFFFGVLGNVLGGLVTGPVLLPAAGTERTVLVFGLAGLLFGLVPLSRSLRTRSGLYRQAGVLALLLAAAAVFPRSGEFTKALHVPPFSPSRVHFEEGLEAAVLTYEDGDRLRNFINGQGHGYRPGPFFLAEAIEGLAFSPSPRNVLVIGFGAGSIAEAALIPAEVERVTVVELCGSLIANLRKLSHFVRFFENPKVRLVIDDGRRFLQRTESRFDVILMDPLRTTTAYSNNLHSRQFFALAGQSLNPGGILMVGGLDEISVIARTLLDEFAFVRAYPSFVLASRSPLRENSDRRELWLSSFSSELGADIREILRLSVEGDALVEATARSPRNDDRRPVSEYFLGLWARRWFRKLTRLPGSDIVF